MPPVNSLPAAPITARATAKNINNARNSKMDLNIKRGAGPYSGYNYFFFFLVSFFSPSGFEYVVATFPPIVAIMPFADSANGPSGAYCR